MTINELLAVSNSQFSLDIFSAKSIAAVEAALTEKNGKYYLKCRVRAKEVVAKPEEIIRQLWLHRLECDYRYPVARLALEYPITFGRDSSKRADIVVFDADRPTVPYIIVEVKQPTEKSGKDQLKSYCHATGAPLAVWSDGLREVVWHRRNPNYFVVIPDLPTAQQTIEDIVGHLFTMEEKPPRCIEYAREKVFGIDFDEKSVRVARCLNLIAGDGETNILHLNTLDWKKWDETTKQEDWLDTYHEGWKKLRKLESKKGDYRNFELDVLMANPPFAGDIKQTDMLAPYDLAHKLNKDGSLGQLESAVGRDLLFIERNLDFLKPGGRMAIVLPQGRFNNSSDQRIRAFIAERCRILAVVGLDLNTFKPHTGTKTSVLFVQKWNNDAKAGPLCKKLADYNIFFATQCKKSKDTSGDKIIATGKNGNLLRDAHGHWVVQHDLFNHDGLTEDGIAEAFQEFAKKEKLSFFG